MYRMGIIEIADSVFMCSLSRIESIYFWTIQYSNEQNFILTNMQM